MQETKKNPGNNYGLSLLYGAVSGTFAKSTMAPLDRMKIIFQTNQLTFTWRNMFLHSKTIIKSEGGIHKLWKGNGIQILRIAPVSSLSLTFQKYFKNILSDENGKISTRNGYIAGFLSGISSTAIVYPLDTLRCRVATNISDKSTTGFIRKTIQQYGFRSLYDGFIVSNIGMMPYSTISWGTMYYLNNILQSYRSTTEESHVLRAISSYIAALIGQTIVYPIDVWRRRIQNVSGKSQIEVAKDIIRERAMFKGLSVNMIKTPIVSTITFTIFTILEQTSSN